jgi:hypothetical protein
MIDRDLDCSAKPQDLGQEPHELHSDNWQSMCISQSPAVQALLAQSPLKLHLRPPAQGTQFPPQSISDSLPFF